MVLAAAAAGGGGGSVVNSLNFDWAAMNDGLVVFLDPNTDFLPSESKSACSVAALFGGRLGGSASDTGGVGAVVKGLTSGEETGDEKDVHLCSHFHVGSSSWFDGSHLMLICLVCGVDWISFFKRNKICLSLVF